ncbi:hypothetical protein EJ110_NYTH57329 [Nymphaea thermarum]|nr:hypothetical protein EJ110_NYTH57329 [Nymphaea thermarum]
MNVIKLSYSMGSPFKEEARIRQQTSSDPDLTSLSQLDYPMECYVEFSFGGDLLNRYTTPERSFLEWLPSKPES